MWISSSTEITQSLQSSPNLKSLEFYSAMVTQFEVMLKESIIFLDSIFKESDIEGKAPIDKEKEAVESEKATTEKDQVSFLKQKLQEFNLEPLKKIEWNEISEIAIADIIANIKDLKTTISQFIDNFKKSSLI